MRILNYRQSSAQLCESSCIYLNRARLEPFFAHAPTLYIFSSFGVRRLAFPGSLTLTYIYPEWSPLFYYGLTQSHSLTGPTSAPPPSFLSFLPPSFEKPSSSSPLPPVSRAYFKMREIWEERLEEGMEGGREEEIWKKDRKALDVGASPGGWTQYLRYISRGRERELKEEQRIVVDTEPWSSRTKCLVVLPSSSSSPSSLLASQIPTSLPSDKLSQVVAVDGASLHPSLLSSLSNVRHVPYRIQAEEATEVLKEEGPFHLVCVDINLFPQVRVHGANRKRCLTGFPKTWQ